MGIFDSKDSKSKEVDKQTLQIAVISGANAALEYMKANKVSTPDEVVEYLMTNFQASGAEKMAALAAASRAAEYKLKRKFITDKEILQHITKEADEILGSMDK